MKIAVLLITFLFCFNVLSTSQNSSDRANELMKEAENSLDRKEYVKARYYFLQSYKAFAAQDNYEQAIKCGLKTNALYLREKLYQEGFDLCRDMFQTIWRGEQKLNKAFYDLRFLVTKERLQMFIALKNSVRAKEQLAALEETAGQAKNNSLNQELLYTKANYYYTFGLNKQGDECFQQLIAQYKQNKEYEKVSDCYRNLIDQAAKANNASLMGRTYEKYILWTDSVKALTAKDEFNMLKQKYDSSLQTIEEKDDALSVKQYKIIALCTVSLLLLAVLIFASVVAFRFIVSNRKLKKNIQIANEHSQLKSQFIQNISEQMEPTLDSLSATANELAGTSGRALPLQEQINALKKFASDIQELSSLENTLNEPYPLKEINVNTFCEKTMEQIKEYVGSGVATIVNAPKLQMKTTPEQLERILLHLLKNAAYYTESGKITLEYKKRGAHSHQFIITDTGSGIAPEQQEKLFKPFAEVKDLTEGDGLGLPICALIATKMNGHLSLDASYKNGARFVLDLHA